MYVGKKSKRLNYRDDDNSNADNSDNDDSDDRTDDHDNTNKSNDNDNNNKNSDDNNENDNVDDIIKLIIIVTKRMTAQVQILTVGSMPLVIVSELYFMRIH